MRQRHVSAATRIAPPTSAFADCVHVSPGPSPAVTAPGSPISDISGYGVETPASGFPPTAAGATGVVTSDSGFPPTAAAAPGVLTSDDFGFPPGSADVPGVGGVPP